MARFVARLPGSLLLTGALTGGLWKLVRGYSTRVFGQCGGLDTWAQSRGGFQDVLDTLAWAGSQESKRFGRLTWRRLRTNASLSPPPSMRLLTVQTVVASFGGMLPGMKAVIHVFCPLSLNPNLSLNHNTSTVEFQEKGFGSCFRPSV